MRKINVPPGTRFGRLTVLEEAPTHTSTEGRSYRRFRCGCDCGTILRVALGCLRSGHTKSCGCLQKERAAETAKKNMLHGMTDTPEHGIWTGMLTRCYNPSDARFRLYGGRGIVVCNKWRESFAAFYADMGPRPSSEHSIDRIDNDKGYFQANCRWATWIVQGRNKRNNRLLTVDGRTLCMSAWAEETGLSSATLYGRLKRGWTVKQALTTAPGHRLVSEVARERLY